MTKHHKRKLVTNEEELFESAQSRYFKDSQEILDEENDITGHILTERKPEITDDRPAHVGFAILAWSKLLFLR